MGEVVGATEQWIFPEVTLTEDEKRRILATCTRLLVEILFKNHIYSFGGKWYRQGTGGPIGLRGTCAVARVLMNMWDSLWERRLQSLNVPLEAFMRYMDYGRVLLHPVRRGWRWMGEELQFQNDWEVDDEQLSLLEVTRRAIHGSMQGVMEYSALTTETEEDFESGWLPTLDLEI